jgi:hypothetical protein
MKNKSEDLRNHLFATLEALQDPDKPMDLERAKMIADVAQVIVNSAKVEVEFARATGTDPDGLPFFANATRGQPKTPAVTGTAVVHKLK